MSEDYSLAAAYSGVSNQCADASQELQENHTNTGFICKHCGKNFTRKYNKERHEENTCSKRQNKNVNTKDNKSEEISDELLKYKPILKLLQIDRNKELDNLKIEYKNNLEEKLKAIDKIKLITKELSKARNQSLVEIIEEFSLAYYFKDEEEVRKNLKNFRISTTKKQESKESTSINNKPIIKIGDYNPKDIELDIQELPNTLETTINTKTEQTDNSNSNTITDNSNTASNNTTNTNISHSNNKTINADTLININNNNNFKEDDGIPFVYPFGYENINFLNNDEMLDILKSTNGSESVVDKIYSHLPNQNFINPNKKDFKIAVLDKDYKNNPIIKYYKLEEFAKKLFENSILLLMRIYHRCHTKLSVRHKLIVLTNIKNIESRLMGSTQLYDIYDTIIAGISNNSLSKRNFSTVNRRLCDKDPEVVKKVRAALESESNNIALYHDDLTKRSLTMEDIKEQIWRPAEELEDMDLDHHRNDLRLNRAIETPRYQKRKELEQDEIDLVRDNGGLLGDIETLFDLRETRNLEECRLLKDSYELKPEHVEELNNLYTKKTSNGDDLRSVRMSRRPRNMLALS